MCLQGASFLGFFKKTNLIVLEILNRILKNSKLERDKNNTRIRQNELLQDSRFKKDKAEGQKLNKAQFMYTLVSEYLTLKCLYYNYTILELCKK